MNQLPRHPALRALVQFEQQKHGVAVRWTEYVPDYLLDTRHRAEIHVITVPQTAYDEREIGVADQRVRLRGIGVDAGRPGFHVESVDGALAVVDGRRVHLLVDVEQAFSESLLASPGRLFDLVVGPALARAAEYVKSYGWTTEMHAYVDWERASVDRQVREWQQAVRDNAYESDQLTARIAALVRKNQDLAESIRLALGPSLAARTVRAQSEFQALRRMVPALVTDFSLDYGKLRAELAPVEVEYDDHVYSMGAFTVTVHHDVIRIVSVSGRRFPHPHVNAEGVPCWGNLGPAIGKLLGQGEHAALLVTIRQFLSSYNPRDAYEPIERWDPDSGEDDDGDDDDTAY